MRTASRKTRIRRLKPRGPLGPRSLPSPFPIIRARAFGRSSSSGPVNSTFTDWHQSITTPNFVWSNDADDSFFTINGGAQQFTGVSYSPDFTGLNITFPAGEPAGTVIMLHGELEYIGGPTFDNNANALVVNQYATIPEPSALALLGLGALGVLVSRRRK